MNPTTPFLADERVRQLRHDARAVQAGVRARHRRLRRRRAIR